MSAARKVSWWPRVVRDDGEALRTARAPRLWRPPLSEPTVSVPPLWTAQSIGATSTNGSATAGATDFTGGTAPTWSANTVSGSYLALVLGFAGDPGAITVSGGGGFTQHGATHNNGTGCYLALFEAVGAAAQTSGTGPTVSWGNSLNSVFCAMIEVKGTATSSPQDGSDQTASNSTNAPAGGAITTTNANDAILAAIVQAGQSAGVAATWSSPTPAGTSLISASAADNVTGQKAWARAGFNYQVVTATESAYTPGCTSSGSTAWFGLTYAVKAAGGASFLLDDDCLTCSYQIARVW